VRFDVNQASLRSAGIRASAHLLDLARRVSGMGPVQ
jgi:hypothetical protein